MTVCEILSPVHTYGYLNKKNHQLYSRDVRRRSERWYAGGGGTTALRLAASLLGPISTQPALRCGVDVYGALARCACEFCELFSISDGVLYVRGLCINDDQSLDLFTYVLCWVIVDFTVWNVSSNFPFQCDCDYMQSIRLAYLWPNLLYYRLYTAISKFLWWYRKKNLLTTPLVYTRNTWEQ